MYDAPLLSVMWDGHTAGALAHRCAVPHVELLDETDSTMDVAHALAETGAPSGTAVLADSQRSGRGRLGRSWTSPAGRGVWVTLIERPIDAQALEVLSLRIGIRAAAGLDEFTDGGARVSLKWPNDLLVGKRKLGGILVEARWTGETLAWAGAGIGVNMVAPPGVSDAAGLREGVQRVEVLEALVRAIRSAASTAGPLTSREIDRYRERDILVGRDIVSPTVGCVAGIDASGALVVNTTRGLEQHRTGTIRLAEDA